MLIDLLNSDNNITININLARIFGLYTAVYCSELIKIYNKALNKNKLVDTDYFKVDRKYVYSKTTVSIEDQLKADLNLSKIGLIKKHQDDPDVIRIDLSLLGSIIISDDEKTLGDIAKKVKVNSPKGIKESQRQRVIIELKNSIECSNYELLTALRNWVDSIYSKPGGYLSKSVIKSFQNTLNSYTQGDLDLALKLVEIATIQGYKDCQWAINVYEKDLKIKKQQEVFANSRLPRVTEQKTADKVGLGEEIF